MVFTLNIEDGRHFEVHFLHILLGKVSMIFFENAIFTYMNVSLLILEIYLLSALLVM